MKSPKSLCLSLNSENLYEDFLQFSKNNISNSISKIHNSAGKSRISNLRLKSSKDDQKNEIYSDLDKNGFNKGGDSDLLDLENIGNCRETIGIGEEGGGCGGSESGEGGVLKVGERSLEDGVLGGDEGGLIEGGGVGGVVGGGVFGVDNFR
jgi:hypothetical protein